MFCPRCKRVHPKDKCPRKPKRSRWNTKRRVSRKKLEFSAKTKRLVDKRDGRTCRVCGSEENLIYDHILNIARGGDNCPENCQILCKRHHDLKTRREIQAGIDKHQRGKRKLS